MKITGITKEEMAYIIKEHEKFGKAFFFHSPCNASGRREYEIRNSMIKSWKVDGENIVYQISVRCSTKHVYADRILWIGKNQVKRPLIHLKKYYKEGEFPSVCKTVTLQEWKENEVKV